MGCVSPVGEQGSVIAKTAALKAGWDFTRRRHADQPLLRLGPRGREPRRAEGRDRGWEDLVIAGGVESMSRVPIGSDGGAWAQDPRDELRDRLRAAGHQRRPDRDARTAVRARTSTARADLAAARRGARRQRRPLRPLGGPGRGRHSAWPVLERDEFIKPRTTLEGLGQLKLAFGETRRDGLRRGRARALPAASSASATCTPPATRRASSTAPPPC